MSTTLDRILRQSKTDKAAHDRIYGRSIDEWSKFSDASHYIDTVEQENMSSFSSGGETKGYVRSLTTRALFASAEELGRPFADIRVLDAGCGHGKLSLYLAAKGFQVIGVDISDAAVRSGSAGAAHLGLAAHCNFLAESLEATSIPSSSIDFIVGHASLHHFIKYAGVPREFARIMRPHAQGFFADSFSENPLYHLFQNTEVMERLGDVRLTRSLILEYFDGFDVELTPTDWFVMLDKLYLKIAPTSLRPAVRRLSRMHFALDRRMPVRSRVALFLSGAVFTRIRLRAHAS